MLLRLLDQKVRTSQIIPPGNRVSHAVFILRKLFKHQHFYVKMILHTHSTLEFQTLHFQQTFFPFVFRDDHPPVLAGSTMLPEHLQLMDPSFRSLQRTAFQTLERIDFQMQRTNFLRLRCLFLSFLPLQGYLENKQHL